MVNFETSVYHRDGEDMIGAKVVCVADEGQTIEDIRFVNKSDYDEMNEKLNSLGSDYVQFGTGSVIAGKSIDDILLNTMEDAVINATLLGGHNSGYYAKSNHTHNKTDITNLYDYDISLSKYNAVINDTITVTASVYDMTGSPVGGEQVIIYLNGKRWADAITNVNGVYTKPLKVTSPGLITFGLNNEKVQCLVNTAEDTEWTLLDYTNNFKTHPTEVFPLKYKVCNGTVNITGRITAKNDIPATDPPELSVIANIPKKYAPSAKVSTIMFGAGRSTLQVQVFPDGRIGISRYGNSWEYGRLPAGWLIRIDIVYLL